MALYIGKLQLFKTAKYTIVVFKFGYLNGFSAACGDFGFQLLNRGGKLS